MSKRKRRKNKKNRNHHNKYSSAPQDNHSHHNNQNRKKNKGRYRSAALPVDDICSEVLDISSRFWTVKDSHD